LRCLVGFYNNKEEGWWYRTPNND